MSTRFLLTLSASVLLSACATVDLAEIAKSGEAVSQQSVERNVVERTASKLYATFISKGWSVRDDRNKIEMTANILLNGIHSQDKDSQPKSIYLKSLKSADVIKSDILQASQHIQQTTKAAEVFLAVAPQEGSLRQELGLLEKAVLAGREAENTFILAYSKLGVSAKQADILAFEQSVDALSAVTNEFGTRVRNLTPATPSTLAAS